MRITFVAACVGFYASALEIKDHGLLPLVDSGNPYPTEMAQQGERTAHAKPYEMTQTQKIPFSEERVDKLFDDAVKYGLEWGIYHARESGKSRNENTRTIEEGIQKFEQAYQCVLEQDPRNIEIDWFAQTGSDSLADAEADTEMKEYSAKNAVRYYKKARKEALNWGQAKARNEAKQAGDDNASIEQAVRKFRKAFECVSTSPPVGPSTPSRPSTPSTVDTDRMVHFDDDVEVIEIPGRKKVVSFDDDVEQIEIPGRKKVVSFDDDDEQIEIPGRKKVVSFDEHVEEIDNPVRKEEISSDEDEVIDSTARDQESLYRPRLVRNEKIIPQGRGYLDRLSDYTGVAYEGAKAGAMGVGTAGLGAVAAHDPTLTTGSAAFLAGAATADQVITTKNLYDGIQKKHKQEDRRLIRDKARARNQFNFRLE